MDNRIGAVVARERKALEAERQRIAGDNDRQAKANAEHERQRADVAAFVKAFPDVANKAATAKMTVNFECFICICAVFYKVSLRSFISLYSGEALLATLLISRLALVLSSISSTREARAISGL